MHITANATHTATMTVRLENEAGQHLDITYNKQQNQLVIDRRFADGPDLHATSSRKHTVEISGGGPTAEMTIFYDRYVVEIFFDHGKYLTTDLVFPSIPYDRLTIKETGGTGELVKLEVSQVKSVWR